MTTKSSAPVPPASPSTAPRLLADLDWCLAQAEPGAAGAVWRLEEEGRQLDANLVRLPPDARVELHQESDVDVLFLPVHGAGTMNTGEEKLALVPHGLMWLPRGSRRSLEAGPEGLAYLTVHQKRAGMRIRGSQEQRPGSSQSQDRVSGEPL